MSQNLLSRVAYAAGLTIWVVASLIAGQLVASLLAAVLPGSINSAVQMTIVAALGYMLALALALGVPAVIWRKKIVTKIVLGISRVPSWSDIGLSILSLLPYYLVSAAVLYVGMHILRVIDPQVGQEVGFQNLSQRIEFFVAFVTLVVMAPLAEELLFRGYFLGRLQERIGKWLAVVITAAAFGLMHAPGTGDSGIVWQWGAAADTFSMALVAGSLRQLTGSIWAGVLLHSLKNAIAFYFLFINPLPPGSM